MENDVKLFNQMTELEAEKKELARVCEEQYAIYFFFW
jgi:hypothetical protein